MVAKVLIYGASLIELDDEDLYHYNDEEVRRLLSRYNGTGDAAEKYGKETFRYYKVFNYYN